MTQRTVTLPGDVSMPLVGFGTWQVNGHKGYEAVRHALEVGYRHIDTATIYENEAVVGRALRDSGVPREEVFLTTKRAPARPGHARKALDDSLAALGVDRVDLWLIHWPSRGANSIATWQEFIAARDEGLTRTIGVSNFSTPELDTLIRETGETPAVNQVRWGPQLYDARRLDEHRERGIAFEGYSPFKTTNLRHPVLVEIAAAHGVTPAQVVLRWHLDHEIVVIPKSGRPARIEANFDVFGFTLTADEVARIDGIG